MGVFELGTGFQLDIVSDQVAPPFLQGANGSLFLTVIGKQLDLVRYRSASAIANRFPLFADPTALYFLGLDRGLFQGPIESSTNFALRLSRYLDDWRIAGTNWSLLREVLSQVAGIASPLPAAWVVNDPGYWSYYVAGSDVTKPPFTVPSLGNWAWDATAPVSYWESYWRCFIGIHTPGSGAWAQEWNTLGGGLPNLGDNVAIQGSLGFQFITPANWNAIQNIVNTYHRAGSWVEYLLMSYSTTRYFPDGRATIENPDGTFGTGYKIVAGSGPQRLYQSSWPADLLPVPMMPPSPAPGTGNNQPPNAAGFKIVNGQYLPS